MPEADCYKSALRIIAKREHSTSELRRKLARQKFPAESIDAAIEELKRRKFLDDARFAQSKAHSALAHKQHGRRRAKAELLRSGVSSETADRALDQVYDKSDTLAAARALADKHAARLKRLDPATAKRRLLGLLQRRGFDYEEVRPLLEQFLGDEDAERR